MMTISLMTLTMAMLLRFSGRRKDPVVEGGTGEPASANGQQVQAGDHLKNFLRHLRFGKAKLTGKYFSAPLGYASILTHKCKTSPKISLGQNCQLILPLQQ